MRFFVNRALVGEDGEGPVYAVEWADDNPFEATEIAVEAIDATGRTVRDAVQLAPFEFIETSQVLSVLLEATVQDPQGRFVGGIGAGAFTLKEDGVEQTLDVVRPETLPATYTLLVDSSQSMARNVDFLRDAAGRLAGHLRPVGPGARRALLPDPGRRHRPDRRSRTITDAHRQHRATGRHRHPGLARRRGQARRRPPKDGTSSSS